MSIPWVEKYRPKEFDTLVGHDVQKNILKKLLNNNNFPNLILYGPPGVGKTTLISVLLNNIYGEYYKMYVLELNGSDDRGISTVRDQIHNYSKSNTIFNNNKFKL